MSEMDLLPADHPGLPKLVVFELTPEETGWAGQNARRLKRLDCLHLHIFMGWPLRLIAVRNGVHQSTVKRWIDDAQGALHEIAQSKGLIP